MTEIWLLNFIKDVSRAMEISKRHQNLLIAIKSFSPGYLLFLLCLSLPQPVILNYLMVPVRTSAPDVSTGCVSHHFIFMWDEVSILKYHIQGILGKFELLVLAKGVEDLNIFLNLTICPGLGFLLLLFVCGGVVTHKTHQKFFPIFLFSHCF